MMTSESTAQATAPSAAAAAERLAIRAFSSTPLATRTDSMHAAQARAAELAKLYLR